ncbi:MAG: nucleotide exchange factor GrpE, partial [Winkia neuii]
TEDAPATQASEGETEEAPKDKQEEEVPSTDQIIGKLGDDLARAKADLYNLNNEYQSYVRRSKADIPAHKTAGQLDVLESLLSVLDDIYGARTAGDLKDGPFAAIAQKLEETLQNRFGLERYGAEGDHFDPKLHEALMANESADVSEPTVTQVLQPGYKVGDRVLRATKVMVSNPA